jgi:hypothetical protein
LDPKERNATIFLHCITFPQERNKETIDLYSYRLALKKAKQIGEVSRLLKIHALDCNLNRDAILIMGQPPVVMIDSQGITRNDVNINDTPFSPLCDWLETCEYKCVPEVNVDLKTLKKLEELDTSTYDEFSARYRESLLKAQVRNLFAQQAFFDVDLFRQNFSNIPNQVYGMLISNILGNKNFHVKHRGIDGYVIYRNKYFLFQPSIIKDESIPLVLRTTFFNVRRDHFIPQKIEQKVIENAPQDEDSPEEAQGIDNKWRTLASWAKSIVETPVITLIDDVDRLLNLIAGANSKKYKRYKQEFESILAVPSLFKNKAHLGDAILQYLFDEWLTVSEQEGAIRSGSDERAGGENLLKIGSGGGVQVFRFVNIKTGEVDYKRVDGEPLPKSLMDIINSSTTDDVLRRRPYVGQIGPFYGFITTKGADAFVFKQGKPVKDGTKPGRGAECAIVSETADKIKNLGEIIEVYGKEHIDDNTFGAIKNMNAIQLCVITNIFLRLMDLQRTRRTRWFFRPVSSSLSGHKGKA